MVRSTLNPVLTNLFAQSLIGDVVLLRQVSQGLMEDIDKYMNVAFDIDARIAVFLGDAQVLPFRETLKSTGGLLMGSFMLALFDRKDFAGSDMDIFVPAIFASSIVEVLLEAGFNYVPRPWDDRLWTDRLDAYVEWEVSNQAIIGILDLYNAKMQNIQIVLTRRSSFNAILSFHSTVVMNVFDRETVFSLYPHATLDASVNLALGLHSARGRAALGKYRSTGYEPIMGLGSHPTFDSSIRYIGDNYTWSMVYEKTGGLAATGNTRGLARLQGNSWSLKEQDLGACVFSEFFNVGRHTHKYFNVVSEAIARDSYQAVVSGGKEPYLENWERFMVSWCKRARTQGRELPVDSEGTVIWMHWSAAWARSNLKRGIGCL
ncbi:hypothetical protein C8J56DRAFT_1040040 [Mycena floridula]|nr:hypothetical protein C8J56DRAFT_1040040 [Mycena floridula]